MGHYTSLEAIFSHIWRSDLKEKLTLVKFGLNQTLKSTLRGVPNF
jgi:hypothetical protein